MIKILFNFSNPETNVSAKIIPFTEKFFLSKTAFNEKMFEFFNYSVKKDSENSFEVSQINFVENGGGSPQIFHGVKINLEKFNENKAEELGAEIFIKIIKDKNYESILLDFSGDLPPKLIAKIMLGISLRSFEFDKYKSKKTDSDFKVYIQSNDNNLTENFYSKLIPLINAINLSRSLCTEAPNILSPKKMAEEAKKLKSLGVKINVYDEGEMAKLGMNALLAVGSGSVNPSFFVTMEWNGGNDSEERIALVGKGVTFDSGGISIKPALGMEEMKDDMAGASIVISTIQLLAELNLKINVVGLIGLAENMPSGSAQRPGDIVKSMSGQTIEVLNTDAEGRMILADLLFFAGNKYSTKHIIDFATLTGAMKVALGCEYAGLFSNDDSLSNKLSEAGFKVNEKLWRLPLDDAFDKEIDSLVADMKNIGSGGGAGSITAAQFLKRFVNKKSWAHIDIAAVSFEKADKKLTGKGSTAFGVKLMHEFFMKIINEKN